MSRSQILTILKKSSKGRHVGIEENKRALSPEGRQAAQLKLAELKIRQDECSREMAEINGNQLRQLTVAARFVVDVNGDSPSIPQLAEVLKLAERF